MEQATNIDSQKQRGTFLTIVLVLILFFNSISAIFYILGVFIPKFQPTEISLWAIHFSGILAIFGSVLVIFLFLWKKWAVYSLAVLFIITAMFRFIFQGLEGIFPLIGLGLLILAVRTKWNLFN